MNARDGARLDDLITRQLPLLSEVRPIVDALPQHAIVAGLLCVHFQRSRARWRDGYVLSTDLIATDADVGGAP